MSTTERTVPSHVVDIVAHACEFSEFIEHLPDAYTEEAEIVFFHNLLDISVWRHTRHSDTFIAEFLLTCGGPTVRVIVDSRWSYGEYHHSWGWNFSKNEEETVWSISPDATELLKCYIEENHLFDI